MNVSRDWGGPFKEVLGGPLKGFGDSLGADPHKSYMDVLAMRALLFGVHVGVL